MTQSNDRHREKLSLTVETGIVGFHESFLHLTILDQQSVTLATDVTEDGSAVEAQVESLGELTGRVTQEADLVSYVSTLFP